MPTRLCPSCHRRIVAAETRCCYCGRESEAPGAERGPAQVVGLDGTPRQGGTRQAAATTAIESTAESGEEPSLLDGASQDVPNPDGYDIDGPGYNPPGSEGYLVELKAAPVHRWFVYPILLVVVLTVASHSFPGARAWLDPARFFLSIASQYAVLCTPFRKWSLQLLLSAALPILVGSREASQLEGSAYVLQVFTFYATAQAQAIGMWRYWRFRYPLPIKRQGPSAAKGNEAPSAGEVA